MFWHKKEKKPVTITFATNCWEKDWKFILKDPHYLEQKQILPHSFPFQERIVILNNINDYTAPIEEAQKKVGQGVLTNFFLTKDFVEEAFDFFKLKREDFKGKTDVWGEANNDWVYFNALGPLIAIYLCQTDYLLYMTGDARVEQAVSWIEKALALMNRVEKYKVANLTWNNNYAEAEKESYKKDGDFFISNSGFSDQMFLVKTSDFKAPIYSELREDASHFPRGEVFEKRVFSFMKNHGWERITYRKASYIHENF